MPDEKEQIESFEQKALLLRMMASKYWEEWPFGSPVSGPAETSKRHLRQDERPKEQKQERELQPH